MGHRGGFYHKPLSRLALRERQGWILVSLAGVRYKCPGMELTERLFGHVDVLASLIGERNSRRPSAIEAARVYITRQLKEARYAVAEQPYAVSSRAAVNLEVTLPGRRPELGELVVGAHYDTALGTPGADDNASAVAALIEIAAGLVGFEPRRTIRLVFYDTEEMPHFMLNEMGSQQHAALCLRERRNLRGMICLESIGYFARAQPAAGAPAWAIQLLRPMGGKHVVLVSNLRSAAFCYALFWNLLRAGWWRTLTLALPSRIKLIQLSDHRGYWEAGYRAAMVTDTALLRNPNYHQPTDLPETLDFNRLAKLTRALIGAIRRMSD